MTTQLRPLPEFPGYAAGNDGHVYSTKRGKAKRLTPCPNARTGIYAVSLYVEGGPRYWNKKRKLSLLMPIVRSVHRLIASVWLPPRPSPAHEIDHRNENRADNRPSNLRWVTCLQNVTAFRRNHPMHQRGEHNSRHKLTDDAVRFILAAEGRDAKPLAAQFGVVPSTIRLVWQRKTWRHIAA